MFLANRSPSAQTATVFVTPTLPHEPVPPRCIGSPNIAARIQSSAVATAYQKIRGRQAQKNHIRHKTWNKPTL